MSYLERSTVLGILLVIWLQAPIAVAQEVCGEWTPVDPPVTATAIHDVTALSANDAWALDGESGTIHWDGNSWTEVEIPDLSNLGSAFSLDAMGSVGSSLFVSGVVVTSVWTNEQLLMIWDGGGWDRVESKELAQNAAGQPRYGAPRAIDGVSADDLWIVGTATSMGSGVVLTVHWNGSQLVEYITPGLGSRQNHLYDVSVLAPDDAWAVGEFTSWSGNDSGALHGMTYHWDGTSWDPVPNPTETIDSVHLHTVVAISSNDVWAAGSDPSGPVFMHWDGSSWTLVPSPPTTGTIQQLTAIASDDVWASDSPSQVPLIGKFYHWDGAAWSIVLPDIPGVTSVNRSAGLAAVGPCDVWAVGSINFGTGGSPYIERLQATTTTGAPPHADGIVRLRQNTPNPFNPSTTIAFRLLQPGHVQMDVYDLSGRYVAKLLDEIRAAGEHTVQWQGRDRENTPVSSGVYLYRLTTEDMTETRRMVLVR